MRHVGYGDDQAETARMVRIGFREYCIVEIPGIGAIDRDQGHVAQVGAAAQSDASRPLRLG